REHHWPHAWLPDGHQPGPPTATHLGISMTVDSERGGCGGGDARHQDHRMPMAESCSIRSGVSDAARLR
ncbi:hypothetical protein AB0Q95_46040, partial [Streptomyces sp. NPDC059900]|uniref:hypothetical protein n=1 Tax=Streptomyces sp. NPDC059900 TaxID=3155816 RepID=UPI00341C528A